MEVMMQNRDNVQATAWILTLIGAINWGLVGLLHLDLVKLLFGRRSLLTKLIYIAVGASGTFLANDLIKRIRGY